MYWCFQLQSLADVSLPATSPLLQSFAHGGAEAMWRRCCEAARECCAKIGVSASASAVENGSIVPLTGERRESEWIDAWNGGDGLMSARAERELFSWAELQAA